MKSDETCSNCGAPANVRCHQCGPYVFFCSDCGVTFHSRWNYHHTLSCGRYEIVTSYSGSIINYAFHSLRMAASLYHWLCQYIPSITTHKCDSQTHRIVTCFHIEGIHSYLY